jgi:hypothetical protein
MTAFTIERNGSATARTVPTGIKQVARLASVFDPNSWRRWPPCVFGLSIDGAVDIAGLQAALTRTAQRHTSLRTHFMRGVLDRGLCLSAADAIWPLHVTDLRGLASSERAAAERRSQLALQDYFDPTRYPLTRAHLLRFDETHWRLGLAVDHLVFDGASIAVFFADFEAAYREEVFGLARTEPSAGSVAAASDFTAFCAQERRLTSGLRGAAALDYWRPIWDGVGPFPPANLPTINRLSTFDVPAVGALWIQELSAGDLDAARARFTKTHGHVSLFIQAASAVLHALGQVTGQSDRALLYTSARRFTEDTARMIADLTDKRILRIHVEPSADLDEHTELVRNQVLDAADYAEIPFEFLRDNLVPDPADQVPKGPYIMLNVDSTSPAPHLPGASVSTICPVEPEVFRDHTWLAIDLERSGPDGATLSCGYQATLFDERIVDDFMTRVASALIRH